jgi:uncharacterized protein (DUF2235 family)
MSRNLVLCFDGTNNEFGSENTSVVRIAQVMDRNPERQRLYYDPGVGTLPEPGLFTRLGKWVSKAIGLAFGTGLVRNVEEGYAYLMGEWEPGDRVFLFGFSRGAYTARVLAGMLHAVGLLPRGMDNLIPYATRLYRATRRDSAYWKLLDQFRWTFARPLSAGDDARHFRTHFLGVWDTVSSVGWVWDPPTFPFTAENPGIDVIRHAVSLDERRWFFRQNLMNRDDAPGNTQDFQQLWFPGVHSDVGGGYADGPDQRLWRIPFDWMLRAAQNAGLEVDATRLAQVFPGLDAADRVWADRPHESLKGAWHAAELFPKLSYRSKLKMKVPAFGLWRCRSIRDREMLDRSTLLRLKDGKYTPGNIPASFLKTLPAAEAITGPLPFKRE